jgi:asparagine synthase (glutamine-hydrolysing)
LRIATEADVLGTATPYWSLAEVARQAVAHRFAGSEGDAVDELERLLGDSVRLRSIADVPLGAFLSGGIDSSLVVALMQSQSTRAVRTFTIGFHDPAYDEAKTARAVARHLGTDHTELYVTADEAASIIPRLPALYDEPFADASQIPTFLVAQLARRHVTVALSGDGGDELFGGYTRYFWAENVWKTMRAMPGPARAAARSALLALRPSQWDSLWTSVGGLLPGALRQRMAGDKVQKLAELLGASDEHDVYLRLASIWKEPNAVVRGGIDPAIALTRDAARLGISSFSEQMMLADSLSYLPDDILAKVDRATMGVSLEGRIPLLDPRLAAFAWRLPAAMKVRSGKGKWPLRALLARYVPAPLFERPKMGFGVPIDRWLRGPLQDWAEGLLSERRLEAEGFFEAAPIRSAWTAHKAGTRSAQAPLWTILMFQAWLEELRAARADAATPGGVKTPSVPGELPSALPGGQETGLRLDPPRREP